MVCYKGNIKNTSSIYPKRLNCYSYTKLMHAAIGPYTFTREIRKDLELATGKKLRVSALLRAKAKLAISWEELVAAAKTKYKSSTIEPQFKYNIFVKNYWKNNGTSREECIFFWHLTEHH